MAGVDITGGGGGISLTKDIYVNTGLIGPFDSTSDVNVFLEDTGGNPITPTSSVLVGNDLTITANIPVPSGVALQFPNPSQGISTRIYDTGWRAQNGWYAYTPPTYPAKYAQLDTNQGANQWYQLKTALTVNGVSNTQRFVDLSGVQGWAVLNNLNLAVLDKLTGLMITRNPVTTGGGAATWITEITTTAPSYSVVINGNTYSDWYVISLSELMSFFGTYFPASPNWTDPITGIPIMPANYSRCVSADVDFIAPSIATTAYQCQLASGGTYVSYNTNTLNNTFFYVHDARNLIS
jgi:hypothetical protein